MRKMTVKGIGSASVAPDLIVFTMDLKTSYYTYDDTMKYASKASQELLTAIVGLGFDEEDLKTTDFTVDTVYESYRDKNDNYKSRFEGYKCRQNFQLEFALDFDRLSQVLTALMRSSVEPVFGIRFTVKDSQGVSEELLRSATKNAREKAEILADASGVQLGDIIDIDYNWSRVDLYSRTDYRMREAEVFTSESRDMAPHIVPEDIDVNDNVTFVWEIH